jgi:hypothetical protein
LFDGSGVDLGRKPFSFLEDTMKNKRDLWYGNGFPAWYDKPLQEMPTATIETKWGTGRIKVMGDYMLEFELDTLLSLHRVTYHVQAYLRVNMNTEEYELQNHSRRVLAVLNAEKKDYKYQNGYQYEQLTDAARKAMQEELKPRLVEWAEKNGHLLLKGHTLKHSNQIQQARHKLEDIERRISERRQYLDMIEAELKATGNLSQDDQDKLNDLWGSSWRFQ